MKQNIQFNFTDDNLTSNKDSEFKRQRAVYLAQRNARKLEAELMMKKDRGHSTSSDDNPVPPRTPVTPLKFHEKTEDNHTTQSSKHSHVQPQQDAFRSERQRYKAERLAHRQEAAHNRKAQFDSSSSDQQGIPVVQKPKIIATSNCSPSDSSCRRASRQEFDSNPFVALNLSRSQKEKQPSPQISARLKMNPSEKRSLRERYEIEVPSRKGINIWLQTFLEFKPQTMELGERSIPLYDISKIKLFFTRNANDKFKMKVTFKEEELILAVDHKKLNQLCLDHYYYFFAKIISLKMQLMGKTPNSQTKPKLQLSEEQLKGAQITGRVRKSSFFGGWEESVGVINQQGLCMYRQGKQKPALVINYNTVRQLWTRFEFNNQNLIIKFLHNSSKVQLSIPCENYLSRDNWLYHIYNLASK